MNLGNSIPRRHCLLYRYNTYMHIPGIGRINKKLSIYFGKINKRKFEKFIRTETFRQGVKAKMLCGRRVNFELVTFADSKNFSDMLESILSFVSSAGLPLKWTIYTDDEFSVEQKAIFSEFDFLVCQDWFTNVCEQDRIKYNGRWQFRKYMCFSTHVFNGTTIFLDSDVLFYEQFNKYKDYVNEGNWYLPEPIDAFSIDIAITTGHEYKRSMFIVNAGFMILNHMPPWHMGLEYLEECLANNSQTYFIDQSALNIVYANDPRSKILEPRSFHVSTIDHFKLGFFKTDKLAIRHYVGPIRYKMWQSGWRQFT